MTTDNRTNEELATRLRQIAESQAMDFDSPHVAMTLNEVADRLSGTATEAQVEAAAKALRELQDFDEGVSSTRLESWSRMVATTALVAAQGAAPQAESKCQTCSREASFCAHCVAEMELAPASSSGLGEDALAEVERAAAEKVLTDAADAVDTESTVWIADESRPRGGAYWGAQDWLRARAEAYRKEGK